MYELMGCTEIDQFHRQMRALLAACRELAEDYETFQKLLYFLDIKRYKF